MKSWDERALVDQIIYDPEVMEDIKSSFVSDLEKELVERGFEDTIFKIDIVDISKSMDRAINIEFVVYVENLYDSSKDFETALEDIRHIVLRFKPSFNSVKENPVEFTDRVDVDSDIPHNFILSIESLGHIELRTEEESDLDPYAWEIEFGGEFSFDIEEQY